MTNVQLPMFSKPRRDTPTISLRDQVLDVIAKHGPVSDADIIRLMRKPANSIRPRRIELAAMGAICKARKEKRNNRQVQLWDVPREAK